MPPNAAAPAGLLAGRVLLAVLFVLEGWSKLRNYDGALGYMRTFGMPGWLLPGAIALELGGGLLLAAGYFTRPLALAFAAFSLFAALVFHHNFASRGEILHFEKDLAIAGGFLALAVAGAGAWSLDAKLRWVE